MSIIPSTATRSERDLSNHKLSGLAPAKPAYVIINEAKASKRLAKYTATVANYISERIDVKCKYGSVR